MLFERKNKYSDEFSDADALNCVKAAARGNEKAFSRLVILYEKDVYNTAIYILKNRDDALDASQDVFLKFWRSIKSFRGDCSVRSYLIKLTKNTAYDILRRQQTRRTVPLVTDEDGDQRIIDIADTSDENDPVKSYLRSEQIATVRKAISMLDEDQRDIIVMRDMNGLSYTDIAQALDIAEGTVKSRISRARAALKKILSELGYE